ncbi:hypothetical protein B296_00047837 [Ensete ventricosum]|uniref:Uncharacterized protein n=1 Tax=Ensete ventricosum TaxID=4639 RepID=A0A426YXM2_ENSVE|nr:hypothetical protein B296_00047837 [Ensete ventricosum]
MQAAATVALSSSPPYCLSSLPTTGNYRCPLPSSSASRSLDRPFCLADPTYLQIQRCRFCSLQRCPAAPAILVVASSSPAAPLLPLPRRTPLLLSSTTSAPSAAPNIIALVGHLCSFSPLRPPLLPTALACRHCLPPQQSQPKPLSATPVALSFSLLYFLLPLLIVAAFLLNRLILPPWVLDRQIASAVPLYEHTISVRQRRQICMQILDEKEKEC